jgi:hypothetical protein
MAKTWIHLKLHQVSIPLNVGEHSGCKRSIASARTGRSDSVASRIMGILLGFVYGEQTTTGEPSGGFVRLP